MGLRKEVLMGNTVTLTCVAVNNHFNVMITLSMYIKGHLLYCISMMLMFVAHGRDTLHSSSG